jgi:hypothetical protein
MKSAERAIAAAFLLALAIGVHGQPAPSQGVLGLTASASVQVATAMRFRSSPARRSSRRP